MIKDKYIDPFIDFGFKRIFGTEANKHLLISFLNDLLDIEDKIVNLEYRNLEKMGLSILDRKAIFDVYCTDERNNRFIVELQRSKQKYFKDRSVYYTSFPINEQFAYQMDLKARLDYKNVMNTAKEEGKIEGRAEGKIEAKINIAIALLDVLELETIALKTGLSLEQLKKLQADQKHD
jgi:hypothetical protein